MLVHYRHRVEWATRSGSCAYIDDDEYGMVECGVVGQPKLDLRCLNIASTLAILLDSADVLMYYRHQYKGIFGHASLNSRGESKFFGGEYSLQFTITILAIWARRQLLACTWQCRGLLGSTRHDGFDLSSIDKEGNL